ncbi:hypothetical protein BSZ39_06355 [Bowdeniella nasicola]|uniref:Nudix hydrolase domain-containing protein n=1 Tax=Bowdeniella nasicola TaxID=208480 RepID=A0A1Q5Q2E4_9ACTO|nr:NUDIX domain-containing protein [Bowdeniella nasicola]OKL54024.1 hypothetical protein BSZ39_06355 [Bowdeniella nasicola]
MPHIFTQPGGHDQTVSAFIFRTDCAEPRILVHRHRKLRGLLQVGGHIEPTENPWQALVREVKEESGYRIRHLKVFQPAPPPTFDYPGFTAHPLPALVNTHQVGGDHFHSDLAYALLAESEPAGRPAEGESTDLRWVSLAEWEVDPYRIDNAVATARYLAEHILGTWQPYPADDFTRATSRAT